MLFRVLWETPVFYYAAPKPTHLFTHDCVYTHTN